VDFRAVAPCSLVDGCQRFGTPCCLRNVGTLHCATDRKSMTSIFTDVEASNLESFFRNLNASLQSQIYCYKVNRNVDKAYY